MNALHIRHIVVATLSAIAASVVVSCTSPTTDHEAHIAVLYTTDIHGAVLPYDFRKDAPTAVSLANVSTYVNRTREELPDGVILLDGGDLTQGNPAMYYYNYVAMRTPHLAARAANRLGYDAVVVGNHDLEAGPHTYADRLPRQFEMPLLAANAIDSRTGRPMFKPYTVVERQGYRIAIVGFITPGIHQWLPKSIWPYLKFDDITESAAHWLPIIEQEEQPDLVIGVFHAGNETYDVDEYNKPKEQPDGAIQAIQSVRGFDLALLGHDHLKFNETVVNDYGDTVCVLEPAAHAEELGRADIHLHRDKDGRAHANIETKLIPLREIAPDHDFIKEYKRDFDEINNYLNRSLGVCNGTFSGAESLVGPSSLMGLIHTVQLAVTGADISFASALSTFSDIAAGDITMRQIFSIYKYENQVHKVWMSGRDVRRYLEWGYGRQFNQMRNADSDVLAYNYDNHGDIIYGQFGPSLKTPQYNFTSAAGIQYIVDITQPAGHRVKILSMDDGTPFDEDHKYNVAINSYQASGGGGFITTGLGWDPDDRRFHTLTESTHDMCYYLADYIRQNGTLDVTMSTNWRIEPQTWWQANRERDLTRLLPYLQGKQNAAIANH